MVSEIDSQPHRIVRDRYRSSRAGSFIRTFYPDISLHDPKRTRRISKRHIEKTAYHSYHQYEIKVLTV
jgi:hypothetical protein